MSPRPRADTGILYDVLMSDVTQVAFQIYDDELEQLDAVVAQGEFRSRAEVLRTAVREFLTRRREAQIDADLAAGYGATPPGPEDEAWAELSVDGLRAANLDW